MSFSRWNRIIVCMNYLYYEYKSSTVCTVKEDEKLYYKSLSTQNYLNEKCLLNGSTLKGRQEAFVYQMKVKKYLSAHSGIIPIRFLMKYVLTVL